MTNEGKEGRWDYTEGDDPEQYYDKSELERARTKLDAEKGLLDKTEDSRFPVKGGLDYQEGQEQEEEKREYKGFDEKNELRDARAEMLAQKNDDKEQSWQKGGEQEEEPWTNQADPTDEPWSNQGEERVIDEPRENMNPNELEDWQQRRYEEYEQDQKAEDYLEKIKYSMDMGGAKFQRGGEQEEEPVEKWDKDDDIGRNYAEPTGDDEPLDDDSYWQGRMEEAEKQVPLTSTGMAEEPQEEEKTPLDYLVDGEEGEEEDDGTTIANSGHRSTYSDYSLGKEAPDDIDPIFGKAEEESSISVSGPPANTQPPANMFDDEEEEAPIGEAKLKDGYIQCPHCDQQFSNLQYLSDHIDETHEGSEAEFKEEDHPRDGGKFTTKGGGDTGKKEDKSEKEKAKLVPKEWQASWDKAPFKERMEYINANYSGTDEEKEKIATKDRAPLRSERTKAKSYKGSFFEQDDEDDWKNLTEDERNTHLDNTVGDNIGTKAYSEFAKGDWSGIPVRYQKQILQKMGNPVPKGYESKATEEQVSPDTYYYDYSDYWKKGDAYQRSGLTLQAGISPDLADSEWDDLPADAQAKIRDAGYVTSYEATEGQGGTYGRSDFMLNPQHEDITTCVVCGRNIDDHSNPNTDYRGMSGTAPATDHYFLGGDQGGSDDKYDFESKASESEWRVHTLTHGEVPITLGEQGDEIDAVNAVKRMYFPEGFIPENEILSVVKIGESLHGYPLYGTENWTVEGEEEEVDLLTQLLDNELEEEEEGHDETEDIALITQLLAPESDFKEDEHPREDTGKFTSGGGDSGGKHSKTNTKDIIKSIKGGNKDWHAWGRTEKNEELYAELERRNREVPKPTSKLPDKVFRDDPDAVSKMEKKVKYWEDQKDYWTKIIKFPSRDYQTPNQLGDARWFMGTNISTNLRDANKKLEGIKAQQGRGTDLIRKPTYKDGKKRFYYSEEPKGEPAEEPWQKGGEGYSEITKILKEGLEFEDSDRDVSPNTLQRYSEPIDLPNGKNALDQTYGVTEPEYEGQDLTGKTVGSTNKTFGADEEIIEKKFTPPKILFYKQYPFGRRAGKQNPFGEAKANEHNKEWWGSASTDDKEEALSDVGFGMMARPEGETNSLALRSWEDLPSETKLMFGEAHAKEQVSIDTMNQAHIWWDNKYPERQWSDMRIGERQNAILAFLRDPTTTLSEAHANEWMMDPQEDVDFPRIRELEDKVRDKTATLPEHNEIVDLLRDYVPMDDPDISLPYSTPESHPHYYESSDEGGQGSGRKGYANKTRPDKAHVGWKNYGIDDYLEKAEKDYEEGKEQLEDPTPWASLAHLAGTTVKDILFPAKEDHSFADMTDKELEELGDSESNPHYSEEGEDFDLSDWNPKTLKDKILGPSILPGADWVTKKITGEDTPMNAGKVDIKKIAKNKTLITPAEEGGKGSGKKDHKGWMKAIEEEHTYDFCENCSMITEQVNHKCDMCGKQVE